MVDTLVDPDEISAKITPKKVAKQQNELRMLQPLRATFSSHLEPFFQYARYLVWSVLNSGPVNSRQARKLTHTIHGWDETLFLKVFGSFGAPGPVTIRRSAPMLPPVQPQSYEGAWAAGKRRELQVVCAAGKLLDDWCAFHHFDATASRYFGWAGYKEVSVKVLVEVAAIHTVNTRARIGRQSKVSIYVTTAFVNATRQVNWSPLRWATNHPISQNAAVHTHLLKTYDKFMAVDHLSDKDSTVHEPTPILQLLSSATQSTRTHSDQHSLPALSSPCTLSDDD